MKRTSIFVSTIFSAVTVSARGDDASPVAQGSESSRYVTAGSTSSTDGGSASTARLSTGGEASATIG